MKKLKMWYIKLAFGALFFTALVVPIYVLSYTVASAQTQTYSYKLIIPAIKVNAPVVPMGVNSDGRMAVPNNFTQVGWYSPGAKPGDTGSTVLGAHVDNGGSGKKLIPGVFKKIKYLKQGDSIYIKDAQGTVYRYVVTGRKIYSRTTADTQEVFAANDASHLNLITCYGTWLPKKNTYDRRIVVSATLVATNRTQTN